ncbi:response regulator [Falsirhodobacter sp. 20TX0035]|uniref:response regulator n=1 Tax=Falsirhodobacter sp. 20TX0035 TaxID=3022019 RepID=UPI00232CA3E3|nr:response regulator [Falsirhodobacter sp. 20TX0035]MDB6453350.1 response regulator [Falsirhodobacter sp. 20TX0035]
MQPSKPLTLFLVEDEALIAMDLECIIEDMGHAAVGPAANVDQAIALLGSLSTPPDAAIVDANLGGVSALPIIEALKAAQIPTIIASGYEPDELQRLGLSGLLIRKPYHPGNLADALTRVLQGG